MAEVTTQDGVRVDHEVTGAGAPLVLVHGLTESRRTWDPLVPSLAETHTVVAVDLPGHGASGPGTTHDPLALAGAVAAVVDNLGLDPPLAVGHSLGGIVVSALAATRAVRGVVNVDQPLELAGFQDALAPLEPALRGDTATFEAAMTAVFDLMAGPLEGDERRRVDGLRRLDQDVVLAIWAPVLEASAEELGAMARDIGTRVTVPYLSLHGIDPGPDYPGWLAEVVPGATVEVWPDLGHYPHLVAPERFLTRLAAFESTLP